MKKQNRLLSLILSLFLLLFTLVPQSALTVKAEGNSEMAVHFIDVGQGNAILVYLEDKIFCTMAGIRAMLI